MSSSVPITKFSAARDFYDSPGPEAALKVPRSAPGAGLRSGQEVEPPKNPDFSNLSVGRRGRGGGLYGGQDLFWPIEHDLESGDLAVGHAVGTPEHSTPIKRMTESMDRALLRFFVHLHPPPSVWVSSVWRRVAWRVR